MNDTFTMKDPANMRTAYFPIGNELGVKATVTPYLAGDHKLDQNTFLLEPTSVDDLHNRRNARNFWIITEDEYWSATGNSARQEADIYGKNADATSMEAGFMWQKVTRASKRMGIDAEVLSFVPYDKEVEIMSVTVKNTSDKEMSVTGIAAIPMYGRSADNLRDHRHVTSLLHRIRTTKNAVLVRPTLSFDERGHQKNAYTYFVAGVSGTGEAPISFFPTVESFIGSTGTFLNPGAVAMNDMGVPAEYEIDGREAIGAMKFESVTLAAGEQKVYTLLLGAVKDESRIDELIADFENETKVKKACEATADYWSEQVNLHFHTGSNEFDYFMRWVSFQPFLRRIYGCSFLPHHDYGKGGRGWRDLWQDCLALLIMNPDNVGQMVRDNFCGVRIDGTNATIIGAKQGEFVADRNNITRVWMDHGMWPYLTTELYINQTGDLAVLTDELPYFKDPQVMRGTVKDTAWDVEYGQWQKSENGEIYKGSVLEHLLIQHICAVCEVGENGNILLRGADWNDAIDMATKRGESVAFTCAYAGNLKSIAGLIEQMRKAGVDTVYILSEFAKLLSDMRDKTKRRAAFTEYQRAVSHNVSGTKTEVNLEELEQLLLTTTNEIFSQIRENEWITDCEGNYWFNSYYDDNGRMVEGKQNGLVRMMLTGQVFSIMSGVAEEEQVAQIAASADKYLYEKSIGGYRLNTNFYEEKYDMGRMFGFAYGEKENGAVFSHMAVMYAAALYKRGFAKEGYKALQTLADAAMNVETSQIYPGVPEYFNNDGHGLYHYLTGAASWYALTMVSEVFGVKGELGNLSLEPKLMPEQFDTNGIASMEFVFEGNKYEVVYKNENKKHYGEYEISSVEINGRRELIRKGKKVVLLKTSLPEKNDEKNRITVELT